ncbi:DUF2124 domain-containing protein [Methanolobus profundi]|uniref:DUF2124 domain-containing protein n=1 Tax=Methanolobus profundi TaxID=487685 RepID=A0A1I4PYR4_9EURY|nr:DUF2124 domain-containing protein [Methanolobus profundi]SFM32543.1 hypothetical protein SAMN04488696_0970 [Methanolobus profundi]
MEIISTSKGIGGQLTEFRKLVNDSQSITFIGTVGFCTPFAELMAFVLRGTDKKLVFLPDLRSDEARMIVPSTNGMQLGDIADPSADTVVLLGGLAMPKIGVEPEKMNVLVDDLMKDAEEKLIIGVCFQSMLINCNWPGHIDFDYIIDADMTNEVKKL